MEPRAYEAGLNHDIDDDCGFLTIAMKLFSLEIGEGGFGEIP